MPGVVQNSLPFGGIMALPLMPAQAMTQQATRHAHRVYVGGLPPLANEHTIATFFSQVMAAIGGNSVGCVIIVTLTSFKMQLNVLHDSGSRGFYLRAMCFPVFELVGDEGVMKKLYEGVMKELHTLKEREPKVVIKFATSVDFDGLLDSDEMHSSDDVNEAKREREEGQQCTTCNIRICDFLYYSSVSSHLAFLTNPSSLLGIHLEENGRCRCRWQHGIITEQEMDL
ncbi:hypothetical protein ACFX12_019456 [Malus domestica]